MFKSIFRTVAISSALLFTSIEANACSIHYTASDDIIELIQEHKFGNTNYDQMCSELNKYGMQIEFLGLNYIAYGVTTATATALVSDRKTGLSTGVMGMSIQLSSEASSDKAKSLLMDAINNSLEAINLSNIEQSAKNLKGYEG